MATGTRLAAVSVDLDEVDCYRAIHGLPARNAASDHVIYDRALPRFQELFDTLNVTATFFAIGRDLARPANRDKLAQLHAAGHEIGNHSALHHYDLTRRSHAQIEREITHAADVIAEAVGERPHGFRAPGYTTTDALLQILRALGYRYDSSVFPCPAYYAAKVAAISALRLRGRPTHSVIDDPRVLRCPADPYRVGRPYWTRGDGILELPIGVTGASSGRLPYIGTSLIVAGERSSDWLTRRMAGRPLVNLELHGIDLADADLDELQFLRPHQPDLRRPLENKLRTLRTAIQGLRGAGYEFVTLAEAAHHFGGSTHSSSG